MKRKPRIDGRRRIFNRVDKDLVKDWSEFFVYLRMEAIRSFVDNGARQTYVRLNPTNPYVAHA
tara:strand:- start:276 stop:464 length:189 start_codon:yes stop_codon:yes gene_type:complete